MTKNRRAKQDARSRMAATGESYSAARRYTARQREPQAQTVRYFLADHCANCLEPLPLQIEGLFCSELCQQTAEIVRYWRRVSRDGRIDQPDVRLALRTRLAHLLAGGYAKRARHLSDAVRREIWDRDKGTCRNCGAAGAEIDHIVNDSPGPGNLQLLCRDCHHQKTEDRMIPASPERIAALSQLEHERVSPDEAKLMCDDQEQWANTQRQLRKERRTRLLDELLGLGFRRQDFPGYSWDEMWNEVLRDELDVLEDEDEDDEGRWPDDFDGGYGPNSYFAHAMAKDD